MVQQSPGHEIGGVLDWAITLFKAAFASVVVLALASALVRSLPYSYPGLTEVLRSSGVLTNTAVEPDELLRALGDLAIALAVAWPIGMFFGLAVMVQMDAVARGKALGWPTALAGAWRRVPALVGCLVVYAGTFVVVFGGAMVLGGVAILRLPLDMSASPASLVAGLIGMGVSLVAAVPLVVLFVYWCLALPLVAVEDLNAVAALRKSWRLVRGNWWRTLAIVSVAGFIVFAVASLAGLAGMVLVAATAGGHGARLTAVLFNAGGATVTTPLFIAVLLALVKDVAPNRW